MWFGVVASIFGQFVIHMLFLPTAVVVLIMERPPLSAWETLRTSLNSTAPIRWQLPLVLSVALGLAGLLLSLVLFRVRIILSLLPALFTFAVLVVFILIVQSVVALVLGIVLTLSYHDRLCSATALPELAV